MSSFQVGGHANVVTLLPDHQPPPALANGGCPAGDANHLAAAAVPALQPHGHRRLLKRTTWGEVCFYSVCQSLARGETPGHDHAQEMDLQLPRPLLPSLSPTHTSSNEHLVAPAIRRAIADLVDIQPPFYGAYPLFPSSETTSQDAALDSHEVHSLNGTLAVPSAPSSPAPARGAGILREPEDEAVRRAMRDLAQTPMAGSSAAEHTWAMLLGNAVAGMRWPHTIDIKLGHVLFDDRPGRARPDKIERMKEAAATSTSASHGVRITGWQHWLLSSPSPRPSSDSDSESRSNSSGSPREGPQNQERVLHPVDKTFGKRIDHTGLAVGLRIFLGCASKADEAHFASVVRGSTKGEREREDPVEPGLGCMLQQEQEQHAKQKHSCPPWVVAALLEHAILPGLARVANAVAHVEMRCRGTSLLLAYESDMALLTRWAREVTAQAKKVGADVSGSSDEGTQVADTVLDKLQTPEEEEEPPSPVATTRLIDFAHAYLAPGQGPDHGLLRGLHTLTTTLEAILADLQQYPQVNLRHKDLVIGWTTGLTSN